MRVHKKYIVVFITHLVVSSSVAWENLPQIPTGRRSQYFLLETNGGYKYGYDTGAGHAGKQAGTPDNQVEGHYFYTAPSGQQLDLKYTSGVQGFIPEGLEALQQAIGHAAPQPIPRLPVLPTAIPYAGSSGPSGTDDQANTGDASYSFSYNTGDSSRQESSDASGNVQGKYAYTNSAGSHDLSYIAGSATGFVAQSGSLSVPNGLGGAGGAPTPPGPATASRDGSAGNSDGSYSFSYNTGDSSRDESADAAGNVRGRYSFSNSAGSHDLSYIAGAGTGFVATGGSLSVPNGLGQGVASGGADGRIYPAGTAPVLSGSGDLQSSAPNSDGSYSFSYNAGDSSRQESGDASGNVQGRYAYSNSAGSHDLSYVAGSETGFVATGGSLSVPNGLGQGAPAAGPAVVRGDVPVSAGNAGPAADVQSTGPNEDGSYSFSYNAGDSSRQETGDASGNVQGSYSYRNSDGSHDLSYVAGSETGFVATGGSLSVPNGLGEGASDGSNPAPVLPISRTGDDSGSDDGSYKGNDDGSDDGSDNGSDDGSYKSNDDGSDNGSEDGSYKSNDDGSDDGSYKGNDDDSGSGNDSGSQSESNGGAEDDQANTGDASYSFTIDTDEYKRQESSDASGNVQGRFSFTNSAGNHDLSYIAGSETGFVATGGSLKDAPGLTEAQLNAGQSEAASRGGASGGSGYVPSVIPTARLPASAADANGSEDDQANTGDASYSFTIDTDEYKRQEASDASGNVQGSYSYRNSAGNHDLSYIAGSETGFVATGGSLKDAPGLTEAQLNAGAAASRASASGSNSGAYIPPAAPASRSDDGSGGGDQANTGDASYQFSIDTDSYKRQESSDSSGNVQGSFSYSNSAGNHDLSFVAGSATGYQPTGGSLQTPPGLSDSQLNSGATSNGYLPPQAPAARVQPPATNAIPSSVKTSYNLGNIGVKTYLPPSNDKQKFGYVFDSQ